MTGEAYWTADGAYWTGAPTVHALAPLTRRENFIGGREYQASLSRIQPSKHFLPCTDSAKYWVLGSRVVASYDRSRINYSTCKTFQKKGA